MRGLELLHPATRAKAEKLILLCGNAGLPIKTTDTLRTKAEQDALPPQVTRAKYPLSMHCWGVAFDFCRNVKGREYDDSDGFFKSVGAIGRDLGLTWGGDWVTFPDRPHFEDREIAGAVNDLVKAFATPEDFKKTWGA